MNYVEFGCEVCENNNIVMWVGKNKKNGGRVGSTRWNGQN